ncbi:hypothetical protein [Polaribacter cellanae]|uniref:Uncharacterized protein n=1 Tax=Polaribacter cellanae TaxID=2818493 RepID=A0A975CSC5_9FLAO|nr:hypothetical protein [Polaribacter cellanae]QTE22391.1 hypothetical protein J3359_16560 [Polaribacter cellanae]
MQNNENIIKVGNALPHGSKKLIAERTNVTQKTVGDFFKCKTKCRSTTYLKIMTEAVNILKELQDKHLKAQALLSLNKKLADDINNLFQ